MGERKRENRYVRKTIIGGNLMNLQQEIATLVTGAIVGLVAETHKPLQLDRDSETDRQTDRESQ